MKAIAAWSGGKDSCLAVHEALRQGLTLTRLFNVQAADTRHSAFGDLPAAFVRLQAELMGVPLHLSVLADSLDPQSYHDHFHEQIGRLAAEDGAGALISGSLDPDIPHGEMMDRLCAFHGLELVAPLRRLSAEALLERFWSAGFEAVVGMVDVNVLEPEWLGRPFDEKFIEHLKTKPGADLRGERGEYDTFVVAGPLFSGRIELSRLKKVLEPPHCRLDIGAIRLAAKRRSARRR